MTAYSIHQNWPYGETYRHNATPYRELHANVPASPGLYSWHFRLPEEPDASVEGFLRELYLDRTLDVQARGNMRQSWRGPIQSEHGELDLAPTEALREFFFALAFPIYIGISRDLRGRLKTHMRELERYRVNGAETTAAEAVTFETDTDAESRSFGQRLGGVFRRAGYTSTGQLFVKHYSPSRFADPLNVPAGAEAFAATMKELRAAETVLNTLFHPALGRR